MNNQFIIVIIIIVVCFLIYEFFYSSKQIGSNSEQESSYGSEQEVSCNPELEQILYSIQPESLNVINDYLSQTECEENFETMGNGMNIGNNMGFSQQYISDPSKLDKALSKSLVPDFEPNPLYISDQINSYGYQTSNPEDSDYYTQRGFMNPNEGKKYADITAYELAHPYQTRYCKI